MVDLPERLLQQREKAGQLAARERLDVALAESPEARAGGPSGGGRRGLRGAGEGLGPGQSAPAGHRGLQGPAAARAATHPDAGPARGALHEALGVVPPPGGGRRGTRGVRSSSRTGRARRRCPSSPSWTGTPSSRCLRRWRCARTWRARRWPRRASPGTSMFLHGGGAGGPRRAIRRPRDRGRCCRWWREASSGRLALITEAPRLANVEVTAPSTVLELPRARMAELVPAAPAGGAGGAGLLPGARAAGQPAAHPPDVLSAAPTASSSRAAGPGLPAPAGWRRARRC